MNQIYNSLKNVDSSVRKLSYVSFLLIFLLVTLEIIGMLLKPVENSIYSDVFKTYEALSKYLSILLNISYSTFASCIFYYFTIHLPEEKKKNISFLYVRERIKQLDSQFLYVGKSIGINWKEDIDDWWKTVSIKLYAVDENTKIEGVEGIIGEPTYIAFLGKAFQIMLEHVEKNIITNIIIDDEVLYAALAIHDRLIDMQSEILEKEAKGKTLLFLTEPLLYIRVAISQLNYYANKMDEKSKL